MNVIGGNGRTLTDFTGSGFYSSRKELKPPNIMESGTAITTVPHYYRNCALQELSA